MADISKITVLNGTTYDIKAYKLKTPRTINVGNYASGTAQSFDGSANITIPVNSLNTQALVRPSGLRGLADNTLQTLVNTTRANRLAFLPADQIIIEQTVDGGTTWTDAGVADSTKVGLFSETRVGVNLPRINDQPNILCGLRITITGMKYNVPSGTSETNKYNYWNSNYIASTERYCQLKELYFWLSSNNNSIGVKVERATGANPNSWSVIFNDTSFYMTGRSGCDYLRFSQSVFGGGTTQTGNFWNYRITLMTLGANGSTTEYGSSTAALSIMEIRGYGDTWWTKSNEYMANDKIYTHDYLKNVTFPAQITATAFNGNATSASKVNNHTVNSDVPANAVFTDTKNTAGSTDTSSKIFLVGATSQAANPQTYSHDTAYVGTDGCLYSGGTKVLTAHQDISGKLNTSLKGAANGLAELDANGKVPSAQLPSYVDDVLEYTAKANFPATGETGKIYVDTTTNLTYRWSGSAYVEISPSLALGETSSTAYRGDRGKIAYDHSQSTHARTDATAVTASSTNGNIKINGTETTVYTHPGSGTNPHGTTKTDVGLGNVGNFKAVSTVASQGLTDTEKSNARANIGAGTSSLVLGTTSSTAYRGDYGAAAYAHGVTNKGSAFSSGLYKITTNSEGHVTAATAVAKADITGLGIPAQDTTYESKAAASGGTDVSLVTTGEKYNWNTHTHNYAGSTTPGGVANLSAAVPIATVDSTSTSTAFTVQVPEFENESELRDGLFFFIYNNKVASASGWTLKVNDFDAKPVYNASAERITTGFAKTRMFPIWYNSTLVADGCWVIGYLTDANTTYSVFTNLTQGTGAGYLANSVVYRYQLLFQMDATQVTPLNNNSNSTGTTKTMLTNVEFDPFGEILYYNTTGTISANARVPGGNSLYMGNIDLRYSFNCGSTLTAFAPFYLVVDLQSNGKVKLASTAPWSQTLPSTNDGHYYILLGRTYSTYQLSLSKEHPIYYYDGSKICEYMDPKKEPKTVNGHTVLSNVPANAVFTDTLYTSSIDNIGSATVGNPITATAITEWIPNTPTSASVSNGVLTFSLGTAAGLTKTNINVPNISVTTKSVVTEVTSSVTGGLPNGDEVSY